MRGRISDDDLKKEFVQKMYSESSGKTYLSILDGTKSKEIQFNKSLYEFNQTEIEDLIKSKKLDSLNSVKLYVNVIKSFIRYCVETGYATHDPLGNVNNSEWIKQFIPAEKPYLPDYKLNELVDKCINPQDAVVLQLLFEGVCGKEYSELLNLKVSDVNTKDSTLKLNNQGKIRYLEVSQKCIDLIFQADKQEDYYIRNGNTNAKNSMSKLKPSEFVVKSTSRGKEGEKNNSKNHIIHRRLTSLTEVFDLSYGTANFFLTSGKIALAKDAYEGYGYLAQDIALRKIMERFNVTETTIDGKKYPPHALKEFTNANIIYNVYGLEFEEKSITPFKLIDESEKDTDNTTEAIKRVKQDKFRDDINRIYSEKCAITNESVKGVLESAHIQGYINEHSHHEQNGMLLRVDFHRLFDRGLIAINDNYEIMVSPKVESSYYQHFNGKKITLPRNTYYHPSKEALKYHRDKFKENFTAMM